MAQPTILHESVGSNKAPGITMVDATNGTLVQTRDQHEAVLNVNVDVQSSESNQNMESDKETGFVMPFFCPICPIEHQSLSWTSMQFKRHWQDHWHETHVTMKKPCPNCSRNIVCEDGVDISWSTRQSCTLATYLNRGFASLEDIRYLKLHEAGLRRYSLSNLPPKPAISRAVSVTHLSLNVYKSLQIADRGLSMLKGDHPCHWSWTTSRCGESAALCFNEFNILWFCPSVLPSELSSPSTIVLDIIIGLLSECFYSLKHLAYPAVRILNCRGLRLQYINPCAGCPKNRRCCAIVYVILDSMGKLRPSDCHISYNAWDEDVLTTHPLSSEEVPQ